MQRGLIVKTVLVVLFGLVFAVVGLGLRERLWRAGPGDYSTQLAVPTGEASLPLRVRVFDSDSGAPLQGAFVAVDEMPAVSTGPDGSALIERVPLGGHTLHVRADGFAAAHREVELEDLIFVHAFRLQKGVALRGVVQTEDGDPVAGARVDVRRLDWQSLLIASTTTDGVGEFAFEPLQERGVELLVRKGSLRGRRFVQLPDERVRVVATKQPVPELRLGATGKRFAPAFELPDGRQTGSRWMRAW